MIDRNNRTTLLLAVVLVGCGAAAPDAPGSSSPPQWTATLESRIGSVDDPAQSLTFVREVLIGPQDQLYIPQRSDNRILVFDAAGAPLATIGREGDGPGEFRFLRYVGLTGDTVYAAHRAGVTRFTPDGQLLTTSPVTIPGIRSEELRMDPAMPVQYVPLADGTALVEPDASGPGFRMGEAGVLKTRADIPILRMSHDQVIDTVAWGEDRRTVLGLSHGGTVFQFGFDDLDSRLVELMPDGSGVVVVDRAPSAGDVAPSYSVSLISPAGDTVFAREFPYSPVPVSDEWVRDRVTAMQVFPPRHPNPPDAATMERALRDAGLVPAAYAPVTALTAGQDGSIWLRRELVHGAPAARWEVLDRNGRVQGSLELPARQTVAAVKDDVVVTTERDDLGVPYVVRYRLTRSATEENE